MTTTFDRVLDEMSGQTLDALSETRRLRKLNEAMLAALKSADESFAQIHKFNRLPAGENNMGWRDVRSALSRAGDVS